MIERYPRDLAVRVLTRVMSEGEPLDEALERLAAGVPASTRAWLQEVCSGTLRWKSRLELAVDSTALRKKPSGWLRKILLIAAYQLIVQERTVPAAVVSETVSEVKLKEGEATARFANASLRRIADHAVSWRELKFRADASFVEQAAWASLPEWLWKRLVEQYGVEWAQAYALASLERPVTWISARRSAWRPSDGAEPGPLPGSCRLSGGGAIPEKKGFAEGEFIVQDISSQRLVSSIAARVESVLGRGFSALDLCAAPGGKGIGLAWRGARVTCTDRDGPRVELLRRSISRVEADASVIARDEVAGLPLQDLVWVDAPCSGTGILRRHPDVRWLRSERELNALFDTQQKLLREAWTLVKSGGFLAYSVCSVLKEEGPQAFRAAIEAKSPECEWFFAPQELPYGDGFWAGMVRKPL